MTASTNGNLNSPVVNYFAGRYVNELRDLYLASMISGLNSVSIGAPGWGKTDIALSMLMDIFPDEFSVLRVHPATPPEEVEGANDTEILLKESRLVKNVVGTPFDPSNKAVLVDEIGRCSKVLVGVFMKLLDRKDMVNAPPVLSTSNFMPKSVESEALLDRIALWTHVSVSSSTLDPKAIIAAQLGGLGGRLHVKGTLPSASDVTDVWDATPGAKATNAVADVLAQLTVEAKAEKKHPHPRRLTQWSKLLYRMSVYETGDADFADVPKEAKAFLRFAWPAESSTEHEAWASIVRGAEDKVMGLVEAVEAKAAVDFNEYAAKFSTLSVTEQVDGSNALGLVMTQHMRTLQAGGFDDDPRIDESISRMNGWMQAAVVGKTVERA